MEKFFTHVIIKALSHFVLAFVFRYCLTNDINVHVYIHACLTITSNNVHATYPYNFY